MSAEAQATRRIGVFGIGSVLMGDDGVGPYIVRNLQASHAFPDNVIIRDMGTPGPDLTVHLAELDALIVVDTVRVKAAPGEVRLYDRDRLLAHAPGHRVGPHDPGLRESLLTLELLEQGPVDVVLIGVVPKQVRKGVGLSPELREAVPGILAEVTRQLERLGARPVRRERAGASEIWWERGRPR